MIMLSKPKLVSIMLLGLFLSLPLLQFAYGYSYSGTNLPSNTIYFDDFANYPTATCTTAALNCLPGWGSYDNATGSGSVANVTTWHPLSSSGRSMLLQAPSVAGAKFDRHRSWAITAGQTRLSISQWFQISATMDTIGTNAAPSEIHFSLEMIGPDGNFHECLIEYFSPGATQANRYVSIRDGDFKFNMSLRAFDVGGFANNPNTLFDNNQWHYEKVTMDITNPSSPTCPYMQLDNAVFSSFAPNSGWTGTPSNPASYPSAATSHPNAQYADANGYKYTRPWRLEIAMINNSGGGNYQSWHTNILITDDSPGNPNIIHFGIITASGLFQLILITTAMMYVSSGFGAVMRVFAKDKLPKFLGPKFIIITGVVGTAGFLFMLIVGANLIQPACPVGFTCSG